MGCEAEQAAFSKKMQDVQAILQAEIAEIETEMERRASEIASDAEAGNDLAQGVGAVAGTVIGTAVGGPVGGATGAIVGKTIGSLFTIEIGTSRQTVSMDVPQVAMRTKTIKFDVPQVTVKDRDISFGVPGIEMRREKGPPVPETVIEWENECIGPRWARVCTKVPKTTIRWRETWYDRPVPVIKQVRIVVGIPEVRMDTQELSLDIPEITVDRADLIFDVPSVTIRFIKDAGRRTAALTAALAQSTNDALVKKQLEFRSRIRTDVAPLALAMFQCYRRGIQDQRDAMAARYDMEVSKLSATLAAIASKGVPSDDPEYVKVKQELDNAVKAQHDALAPIERALADFDASTSIAMQQLLNDDGSTKSLLVTDDLAEGSALDALVSVILPT